MITLLAGFAVGAVVTVAVVGWLWVIFGSRVEK